jgi:HEAT repeat protein
MKSRRHLLCIVWVLCGVSAADAQEPPAPRPVSPGALSAAIDKLGDLDYATRTNASKTVRRTALMQAVSDHRDGYVRYRALVLLTGFNDPRTVSAMRESRLSPNDRLRSVAYRFFEQRPDASMAVQLVAALDKEQGEFVRPALVRALAALAATLSGAEAAGMRAVLVRESGRGEDYFRSAVIEALGDYKAAYAFDALVAIAKLEGPLQDDSALALGKIGDKRALETLAVLQRTAPRQIQPSIAAAICLLGINCETHRNFLI